MAAKNGKPIVLASRDSLLALTQTIDAALRLEKAGFSPKIVTLKTAGDLKLDAPLYNSKEGKAFFTRELDDALLAGKAHAAVHSFKDLPTEKVPGISDPVFFSETNGADVVISRDAIDLRRDAPRLIMGTSSLRRLHQLSIVYPGIRTEMLRGNIVTRLRKLVEGDRGINAILIAAAGIERMTHFSALDSESYAHFLDSSTAEHIAAELGKFREYLGSGIFSMPLHEEFFPTAPGQGVLALQLSDAAVKEFAGTIQPAFPEHGKILSRVMLERGVMSGLNAGCHAPLGVSVFYGTDKAHRVSLCYSRQTTTSPVSFSDTVFLRRQLSGSAAPLVREILSPFKTVFWWGLKDAPVSDSLRILGVRAVQQAAISAKLPHTAYESVFVASAAVIDWLRRNPPLLKTKIFAAGSETAAALKTALPGSDVEVSGRGFAAALAAMPGPALWLGSKDGEARARKIAATYDAVDFLPVYENTPLARDVIAENAALGDAALGSETIHLITSAAAARAFTAFFGGKDFPVVSCFGPSAADVFTEHGFTPYHVSDAETFGDYLEEIRGTTGQMHQRG